MRQTAACTLNIPGNLSGRFIIVRPLLNTPWPPPLSPGGQVKGLHFGMLVYLIM